MSGREGCSSSSAQASGSERRKVVHPSPKNLNDSLYEFYKPEGNPSMQVVFVHGIHSEDAVDAHLSTWESEDGLLFWPQRWLAEEFPTAHIFTAKYIGGIGKRSQGKFDLYQIAENLLSDLMGAKVGQNASCPVVLVGHCFGGIVIKHLCLHASKRRTNPKQREAFIENVRGIFYYSTPHLGFPFLSEKANLLQTPLLGHLKILSDEAARVNFEFDNLPESGSWRIDGIGENLRTKSTLFPDVVAVPEASCRRGNDFRIVAANHISISKPPSKTDTRFSALTKLLHEVASKWEEDSRPENFQRLPKEMIDMQVQVKEIVDKLKEVRILGFCGMGGLGKTTLAKAVFNELNNSNFEYSCFVSDAKLITGTEDDVKKKLSESLHFQGRKVGGQCNLAVLRGKRMLLVLDDVSERDGKVLLDLAKDTDPRSRFISTSREFDRLDDLGEVHRVPYLDSNHAKLLFTSHAFRDGALPCLELESMLEDIVNKCDGLPLALEVVGKSLRGKVKQEVWKQTLIAMEKAEKVDTLNRKLWAKLRISFENLGEKEQQVFLDATNFFVGDGRWTLAEAKAAWTVAYETGGELLWQTLVDMSLVDDVGDDDRIRVHEQLRGLGRMIASEPDNKGKYVIFDPKESRTTLEEELAANGQECHALRFVSSSESDGVIHISSAAFHKLKNLRFLQVDREVAICGASSTAVHQCGVIHILRAAFHKLKRFLQVDREVAINGASSTAVHQRRNLEVPTKLVLLKCVGHGLFNPSLQKHLAILDVKNLGNIPSSIGQLSRLKRLEINRIRHIVRPLDRLFNVESLPESFGQLTPLEHLTLSDCTSLRSLPESFGQLRALQHLKFKHCGSLRSLPESFGQLRALQHLKFKHCGSLRSLPESFGQLRALQHLTFWNCSSLQSLPESFGQLRALQDLDFSDCGSLQSVPESIGQLSGLTQLRFSRVLFSGVPLQSLPESIGRLSALTYLQIDGSELQALPESIGRLSALTDLQIYGPELQALPESIGGLSALTGLKIYGPELQALPESIGRLSALTDLEIHGRKIQALPESIGQLSRLTRLKIVCPEVQSLPDSVGQLSALTEVSIFAEGLRSLPESIGQLSRLTHLQIVCRQVQSLPDSVGQLSALTRLSVQSNELRSLPDSIGQLSGLTHLSLSRCRKLRSLPESLGKLSSLSQVHLVNCYQLCNLPESSGQLTNLKCLSIGSKQGPWYHRFKTIPGIMALESGYVTWWWLLDRDFNWNERVTERLRTLPNRLGSLPNLQYLQLWGFSAASIPDSVRGMPSLRYVEIMQAERVDQPWPVWLVDKTDPNTPRPVDSNNFYQIFEVCDGRLFLVEEDRLGIATRFDNPRGFERPRSAKTILHGIEGI